MATSEPLTDCEISTITWGKIALWH
jgi:hypothetical protein